MTYCHNTALLNNYLRQQDEEEARYEAINKKAMELMEDMSVMDIFDHANASEQKELEKAASLYADERLERYPLNKFVEHDPNAGDLVFEIMNRVAEKQLIEEADEDFIEPEVYD